MSSKNVDPNDEDFKVLLQILSKGLGFSNYQLLMSTEGEVNEYMTKNNQALATGFGTFLGGMFGAVAGWHKQALNEMCNYFKDGEMDMNQRINFFNMGLHMLKIKAKSELTYDIVKKSLQNLNKDLDKTISKIDSENASVLNDSIKNYMDLIVELNKDQNKKLSITKMMTVEGSFSWMGMGTDHLKKYLEGPGGVYSIIDDKIKNMETHIDNFFSGDEDVFASVCKNMATPSVILPGKLNKIAGQATVTTSVPTSDSVEPKKSGFSFDNFSFRRGGSKKKKTKKKMNLKKRKTKRKGN